MDPNEFEQVTSMMPWIEIEETCWALLNDMCRKKDCPLPTPPPPPSAKPGFQPQAVNGGYGGYIPQGSAPLRGHQRFKAVPQFNIGQQGLIYQDFNVMNPSHMYGTQQYDVPMVDLQQYILQKMGALKI